MLVSMKPVYSFLVPCSMSRYPNASPARLYIGDAAGVDRRDILDDLGNAECLVALLGRGEVVDDYHARIDGRILTIESVRNHPCSFDSFDEAFALPEGFEIRADRKDRRYLVHAGGRVLLTSDFAGCTRQRRRKILARLSA